MFGTLDIEFEKVKDKIDPLEVNTTATYDHVGETKRWMFLSKEQA